MPRPKEDKEQVVYPPSKRKAPAYKPQRPAKAPRTATIDSERSSVTPAAQERPQLTTEQRFVRASSLGENNTTSGPSRTTVDQVELSSDHEGDIIDSSDDLPDNPLATVVKKPAARVSASKTSTTVLQSKADPKSLEDALAPDIDKDNNIPQSLLLRLMHEHFQDKGTKIDKVAIGVMQKYVDLFVRETMARAALGKQEAVELGKSSQSDVNWLDKDDLERVAGGMLMDF